MIQIAHVKDVENVQNLPTDVVAIVVEIATVLDDNYGDERDVIGSLGGYILIVEDVSDRDAIVQKMDFSQQQPEFVELVTCSSGENYTSSLILLSSDYSLSLLIPYSLTPHGLLAYLEEKG